MRAFIITTIVCFIIYLLLTTSIGIDILGFWSYIKFIFGILCFP